MAKLSGICFLLLVLIVFTGGICITLMFFLVLLGMISSVFLCFVNYHVFSISTFQFIEPVFNGDFKFADEILVPVADAKDCNKVWNCKGGTRCWNDCKNRYNGTGLCDLYTAPGVPKQCFCAYKC